FDSCPSSDSLTIHVVVLFFTFALALWAFETAPKPIWPLVGKVLYHPFPLSLIFPFPLSPCFLPSQY
ncbi:hypothetical protein BGY98DRAFT_997760, partial [Russula aff. rugulosa BPL654]